MSEITEKIIYVLAFLIAIVFHEYAHGYAAYRLGDPTAKRAGRLTLNPIAHIDPIGLISMILFRFGWAKGVPINPNYFKNRKRDTLIVSVAGIFTNFVIAIVAALLFKFVNIQSPVFYNTLFVFAFVNVMLGVFNLLPFPPLDGSKILFSLLPTKIEFFLMRYEKYLYIILIALIFTRNIGRIITPIIIYIMRFLFI